MGFIIFSTIKTLWIVILISALLISCDMGGESREAVCRHKTVLAALVYSEYYPIRIAYGPNDEEGYHCQAQAYIGGEWYFLHVIPSQIVVITDEKDDWYTVSRYFDVEIFIKEFWFNKGWGK